MLASVIKGIVHGAVAILVGVCAFASAQVPDDLAAKKEYKSLRASSTDPNGHNHDSRPVPAGGTIVLADIKGAGQMTHLWMTISSPSPDHLRELVLRMTWDDAATPAVECPIGDFFAQGPSKYVEFSSAPVSVGGSKALNCYWPMPFKRHAVITVTNEGSKAVRSFYWNFDYRLQKRADREMRYFHTQYRNFFPAPVGRPLTICDVKGAGHFVGTILTVLTNSDGWWGEGNDIWTVDGVPKPTITGTGSEDYFCGAWGFLHPFFTPYAGVSYWNNPSTGDPFKRDIVNTCYRWHILDAVPFTNSLVMELEHGSGGGNEDRKPFTNHYTTVGLYYVDHPGADIPAINKLAARIPTLIPLPR